MDYEVVALPEKTVEGYMIRTRNEGGQAVRDIGKLWQAFFGEGRGELIQNKVDNIALGVYTDYESDESGEYSYLAGYAVEPCDGKATLGQRKIAAGRYAKFTASGDLEKMVGETWQAVWSAPLKRKYASDFEEYLFDDDGNAHINIYISIY